MTPKKGKSRTKRAAEARERARRKRSDSLIREMYVLTLLGPVAEPIRGSRAASMNASHAAAVQHFLRSGDGSRLAQFHGKRVAGHELIVDTKLLSMLAEAGALRLDNLYSTPKRTS
jgi:hypothetical protein